jgi:hypothetical protein
MRRAFAVGGLAAAVVFLGLPSAQGLPGKSLGFDFLDNGSLATPAAMCGYSCRSGGRYIPGPPSVCAENGLNYCGPSRGPPEVGRLPYYRGGAGEEDRPRGCRTITVERDDGSIRRIRRCD